MLLNFFFFNIQNNYQNESFKNRIANEKNPELLLYNQKLQRNPDFIIPDVNFFIIFNSLKKKLFKKKIIRI